MMPVNIFFSFAFGEEEKGQAFNWIGSRLKDTSITIVIFSLSIGEKSHFSFMRKVKASDGRIMW
jgi:hypothetical protein